MGIYQILYMDTVPDSAAVNECVTLTRQVGKSSASGFVNAVLRRFLREGKKISLPEDSTERLSVEYSCAKPLVERLCGDYSYELAKDLLRASVMPHKTFLRANTLKISPEELVGQLEEKGISARVNAAAAGCVETERLPEIDGEGLFHVQDLSSQLCCAALGPKPGETVLDMCAAPGGKSFTIAEMMCGKGRVIACDLHEKRVNLIKSGAERLGITSIEAVRNDAKVQNPDFPAADRVLCDVPCSGFGVMRSKPELKYTDLEYIKGLPEVQYQILRTSSAYVKPGGTLVYSTCTLNRDENDRVAERFLAENSGFREVERQTIFPRDYGCEGFFFCKFGKAGAV